MNPAYSNGNAGLTGNRPSGRWQKGCAEKRLVAVALADQVAAALAATPARRD